MTEQDKPQWYLNTKTGEAEFGPKSPMEHRIGPYESRETALKALDIAKKRNEEWEDYDRKNHVWGTNEHHYGESHDEHHGNRG